MPPESLEDLLQRNRELQLRLEEAEATLSAIRNGEVDAVVASGPGGDRVYTLKGADEAYRVIVQGMAEAALTLSPDGLILFSNEQFASMLRMPLEHVIGARVQDFVAPEYVDVVSALLTGRSATKAEVRLTTDDGLAVPAYVSANAVTLDGVGCICLIVTDLTEQKRGEEILAAEKLAHSASDHLQQANARFRALIEASPLPVLALDAAGVIESWNQAAERVFGWTEQEVVGKVLPCIPDSAMEEFRSLRERILNGAVEDGLELIWQHRDGSLVDVSFSGGPLRNGSGAITGIIALVTDITEHKRLEERFRHAQRLESIGLLAGGIAHDFNNLLTGVIGNLSLVLEGMRRRNKVYEPVERAMHSGKRAAKLTQQLLAYSGKGRFIVEPVNLSRLATEVLELVRASIPEGVEVILDLDDGLPEIEADASQINHILINLLINAAEAIGSAAGQIRIVTRVEVVDDVYLAHARLEPSQRVETGAYVCLEVQDSGCGMDQATLARIFDPFFTTKFTGRGLGLAAVQGIVRGHKGLIIVESAPEEGTTFRVLFPSAKAVIRQLAPQAPAFEDLKGTGIILVVDDEDAVRRTAKAALERYGYSVIAARGGREGVEVFKRRSAEIALVLLDMTLPVMSGQEVFRRLRAIRGDIPVVLSSGYNEGEAIRRFAGMGLAGFVGKPYTAAALGSKVKAVLAPMARN